MRPEPRAGSPLWAALFKDADARLTHDPENSSDAVALLVCTAGSTRLHISASPPGRPLESPRELLKTLALAPCLQRV